MKLRKLSRRASIAGIVLLLCGVVAGCVSTVSPPADPEDPLRVYLIYDARHRGLALPRDDDAWVVYGFGDWDWYAMNHDSWYHVFDTVLWPTQGTLGWRIVSGGGALALRRAHPGARLVPIIVAARDAASLLGQLDAEFEGAGAPHLNRLYRMRFVRHGDGYWFCYNCNDAVASWLRRLGCAVSWVPIRLDLEVARP